MKASHWLGVESRLARLGFSNRAHRHCHRGGVPLLHSRPRLAVATLNQLAPDKLLFHAVGSSVIRSIRTLVAFSFNATRRRSLATSCGAQSNYPPCITMYQTSPSSEPAAGPVFQSNRFGSRNPIAGLRLSRRHVVSA